MRGLLRRFHLGGEVRLELGEVFRVGGDTDVFHLAEDHGQRLLDVHQQRLRRAVVAGQLLGDGVGQVERGAGAQHDVLLRGALLLAQAVEGELAVGGRVDPQLALEVAQRQVGQVIRPLVGFRQIGGQRGVDPDAGQLPAVRTERQPGRFGVVDDLGPRRIGQPGGHRTIVVLVERRRVEPGGRPVSGDRQAGERAGTAPEMSGHRDAEPGPRRAESRWHRSTAPGRLLARGQVEAGLGLGLHRVEVRIQPLAQDAELERVEDLVHRLAVPRPQHVLGAQRQFQVADQRVELVVAQHTGQVGAQALAGLALDLVDVRHDAVEAAVLADPFGRGLVADAGDAGQVVAGLADQRRLVAVALGARPVLLSSIASGVIRQTSETPRTG